MRCFLSFWAKQFFGDILALGSQKDPESAECPSLEEMRTHSSEGKERNRLEPLLKKLFFLPMRSLSSHRAALFRSNVTKIIFMKVSKVSALTQSLLDEPLDPNRSRSHLIMVLLKSNPNPTLNWIHERMEQEEEHLDSLVYQVHHGQCILKTIDNPFFYKEDEKESLSRNQRLVRTVSYFELRDKILSDEDGYAPSRSQEDYFPISKRYCIFCDLWHKLNICKECKSIACFSGCPEEDVLWPAVE